MCSPRNHQCAVLLAAAFTLSVLFALPAFADSGTSATLPNAATAPGGLRLNIESRWAGGSGYHPVTVSLKTAPPTPALGERSFRIEFQMRGPVLPEPAVVSQFIDINQNQTGASALVLIPQSQLWNSMEVTVYEDGVLLPNLSRTLGIQGWGINQVTEAQPAAVFISSRAPLLKDRARVVNRALSEGNRESTFPPPHEFSMLFNSVSNRATSDAIALQNLINDPLATLRNPAELPDRWQAYTSIDVVFIGLDDWLDLQQSHPQQAASLLKWVRWGGNFVVFGLEPDSHQSLLDSVGADSARSRQSLLPTRGSVDRSVTTPAVRDRVLPPRQTGPNRVNTLESTLGMGLVLGVELPQTEASRPTYANVLNTLTTNRWKWYRRLGISNIRDGTDYSTHNIPGVGEPPLLTFLGSITLFVIVIGPFNYLLLKRWQRLYLLLVTVPTGATLVTMAIFISAVIGDGLGVKVLHRSFTDLDQLTGQAATWNRQTYYAGMAPRELVFPTNAAVFPIINPVVERTQVRDRSLHWDEAGQHFGDGYISSRRMDQFLVTNSGPTTSKLEIQASDGVIRVANELDAEIRFLIVTDKSGKSFVVESLPAGENRELAPADGNTHTRFQKLLNENDPRRRNNPVFSRPSNYRTYRLWNLQSEIQQIDSGEPPPDSRSSRMEACIAECATYLPRPGHYYAVISRCPWAEAGCRSRELPDGFHLVRGRWQ